MVKKKIVIPSDVKREIRDCKEQLDTYTKDVVSQNRKDYEDFVGRVESTSTLIKTDTASGLEEIKNLLIKCVPETFLEECREEVSEYLDDPDFHKSTIDYYVEKVRIEQDIHLDKIPSTLEELSKTDRNGLLKKFDELYKELYISQSRYDINFVYNFYNLVASGDDLAIFTYYYFALDHGYLKVARMLPKLLLSEDNPCLHLTLFKDIVSGLVSLSTSLGSEDKKSWNNFAETIVNENEELWKEIVSTLRYVIENKGQKKIEMVPLHDMLIGNKDELLQGIEQFLNENKEAISLAYLLLALERTEHIECSSFRVFCKAVNMHFRKEIGFRKGLDRYNEIKNMPRILKNPDKKTWKTAKATIDTWVEIFSNCA